MQETEKQNFVEIYGNFFVAMQILGNDQLPATLKRSVKDQKRFLLLENTDEYQSVLTYFNQTINGKCNQLIKIERIQNETCFGQYLVQCQEFEKRLKKHTEKRLYHGCPEQAVNSIIETNFDKSFSGLNGAIYGVGVYFSSKADFSHGYTVPNDNGERYIFLARVLLGKITSASKSMKSPPPRFDSATDRNLIYVTYHDAQTYPEYLITYR
ncbi:unnamed protein product [Rotaria magnacalcarata]|nr:unnamed protein product [Rotaria magnacalcarata]